jgi:hypothetical protein
MCLRSSLLSLLLEYIYVPMIALKYLPFEITSGRSPQTLGYERRRLFFGLVQSYVVLKRHNSGGKPYDSFLTIGVWL